ncbi:XRE family transcriptional regulator, partial [Escherichia coli]
MENSSAPDIDLDQRLAGRLKALRTERGWPLDELAS